MQAPDLSRGKRAIFIGSNVCVGAGATDLRGWSTLVAERMERNGWSTHNCAIGGQKTSDILLRLERDVIEKAPAVCFVGLGLSNEGLTGTERPEEPCAVYLSNLRAIVEKLKMAGIYPVIGGIYPNDEMGPRQYACALAVYARMNAWEELVLQWMPGLDDGQGHYRPGLASDALHPNDAGYAAFYSRIPGALWEVLDCPKP